MIDEKKAKKYCKDDISKIENYHKAIADKTQTWVCHHRTEIWWNCTYKELIENECYYNRKACELIFLTPTEHKSLHMSKAMKGNTYFKGHTHTEESCRKMSESRKGKKFSDDTRRKISKKLKGRTSPVKDMTWKLIDGKRVYFLKEV